MRHLHVILMPLLILSLIGSGSALAWTSACCPPEQGQAMSHEMDLSMNAMDSVSPTTDANTMETTVSMSMADCEGNGEATGMCCLGGVMGPPSISFTVSAVDNVALPVFPTRRIQQSPSGLFRPPKV